MRPYLSFRKPQFDLSAVHTLEGSCLCSLKNSFEEERSEKGPKKLESHRGALSLDEHMAEQMTTQVAPKSGPSRTPMSPLWASTRLARPTGSRSRTCGALL